MNEYVNTVVILPPSETHQLSATTTTEDNFSQNEVGYHVNMETSSRNVVLKIILDFFLMATRKQ